ncbi:hypothetical protein DFJ58DRAFT_754177 [Suillus subalutaceus]|uniref:uncharacterized protein n=1 Tax=Suillus subalutaceus TaxID=48586 RepID=UPI001B874992|nr:uncharacterized protein DFJ58DRAFT_754177 [Suillus subalutaceus]KAG1876416.1 hypothetical protein DFJ58DRAFT_754177 [Suillus subalutaceus]
MSKLKAVVELLQSSKVKERQEGIISLKEAFSRDDAVLNLGEGRAWLVVYQALFTAVTSERAECDKKATSGKNSSTGAAALRRLGDATTTVRWLVERSNSRLTGRVVKSILTHLLQMMVFHGQLYAPLALDYLKTLKILLGWTPHMDRIEAARWISIAELAFNIILDDPIKRKFNDVTGESNDESMQVDLSAMYQDDSDEGDDHEPSTSTQKRKRKAREHSSTPTPGTIRPTRLLKAPAHHSVSLEQVECASLLALLFRSPAAPFLSEDVPNLSSAILARMTRFLERYHGDASLHHDYLLALQPVLSHLCLNRIKDVKNFAHSTWNQLVGLWGTKNKRLKESLVGILRTLFPFLTAAHDDLPKYAWADGVYKLWTLLSGEAESRWGLDSLSLDSLRLEVLPSNTENYGRGVFVARTFRAGWHFESSQALAWALMELQADCAEKLFDHSEWKHADTSDGEGNLGKRAKRENPIVSLIHSIQSTTTSGVRTYHLQVLLFFIDRHWSCLHKHNKLQENVMNTLLQFVSVDDPIIQSWTFLCFAAIAQSDGLLSSRATQSPSVARTAVVVRDSAVWDPVWTHAMRRANVPVVCRAACHTAYTLILHSKFLLTSQRVLIEIETLAKDLDLQGPAFPYDSVCMFLAQCLHVASQDVRLYRMQLEEKVLSWLLDNWRIGAGQAVKDTSGKSRMPLHTIGDILGLLESICGTSKRSDLLCRTLLPDCAIAELMEEERKTKVIRDFLLDAQLPSFRKDAVSASCDEPTHSSVNGELTIDSEIVQPRGRERRVTSSLLKAMESLTVEWDMFKETNVHPTAEKLRQSLDAVVTAFAFETLLVWNGMRCNRRVLQSAGRVISLLAPFLTDARWTADERVLILHGLEPLVMNGEERSTNEEWEAMLGPDLGSGIRSHTLKGLKRNLSERHHSHTVRRLFQRVFWANADIQDAFSAVSEALRESLRTMTGQLRQGAQNVHALDADGFGDIMTTHTGPPTQEDAASDNITAANRYLADLCITFLATTPVLRFSSAEVLRDRELTKLILHCPAERLLLIGNAVLGSVRRQIWSLDIDVLNALLDKLEDLLGLHTYDHNVDLQLMVVDLLDSTSHFWLQKSNADSDVGDHIRELCGWLSQNMIQRNFVSWKIRDFVSQFFARYIAQDPSESFWPTVYKKKPVERPSTIIPMLNMDQDIRVRFRAAVVNARLFTMARFAGQNSLDIYNTIKEMLTKDLSDYEKMLTRTLCLGNIMVVSSAVRRGPYWHLIEAAFHSSHYAKHIQATLTGVSERLGLPKLSDLFEAYASQIAYSIRQAFQDVCGLPPELLGYRDRKECAEATFRLFTPTNVMAGGGNSETVEHGRRLFLAHCATVQKTAADGLQECLGDLIGFQLVFWLDDGRVGCNTPPEQLKKMLKDKGVDLNQEQGFNDSVEQNAASIAAAVVRSLGDQDFSADGPIMQAIKAHDSSHSAQVFKALSKYRTLDDFNLHSPNLPAFGSSTVLRALNWCISLAVRDHVKAISYHVLHQLFSEVQRSPLVNEQIRLLNGISLLVAVRHEDFQEPTLLHTLIHEATSLLAQVDLVQAARSFLEWGFTMYLLTSQVDPRFPDVLIRVCAQAHDYSLVTDDVQIATIGRGLLHWIDRQALELCRSSKIRSQVMNALSAWPHQPSSELLSVYEDITADGLSMILSDFRIASNKFRLVRRFRDLAEQRVYDRAQFAKTDFWRLKDFIPTRDQLQPDDVDAFASLLIANNGDIYSFGSEQPFLQTLRGRHRRSAKKSQMESSPQRVIIQTLLAMMDGNSPQEVNLAYSTLRSVVSASSSDMLLLQSWPVESRAALEYLQQYPIKARFRHVRGIDELEATVKCHLESEFQKWISELAILLSDVLSAVDPFYAQFSTFLERDVSFADEMLPVLVHTLLQNELDQPKSTGAPSKSRLSEYFSAMLMLENVHLSCLRSIVGVVLHLRNFCPKGSTDSLAHDKWLDIDYMLLARSAVTCGAYTTALLFLELAAEYQSLDMDNTAGTEHLLFEIYSHIDEPDGFYGIKTADLRHFLIKRFHHEKQWEKAFRFHGAALEAGSPEAVDTDGLLSSFHAFGFDRLAIGTLQTSQIGLDTRNSSSAMCFQLGWRTETWDLPDNTGDSSGATLYQALRAVYRERDPRAVDAIVRSSLDDEMTRLRQLGTENISGIREVARNIMCLGQITQWRSHSMQQQLSSKSEDTHNLPKLDEINSDFEFTDLEQILATRISLVRSVRQKEERKQIGSLTTPFVRGILDIEKRCLVRLSIAARKSNQLQVALNSIVKAQRLERNASFEVAREFANVLWLQKEQKLAVQYLKDLVDGQNLGADGAVEKALSFARLGDWIAEACLEKPTDIKRKFFDPAVELAIAAEKRTDVRDHACATVFRKCALFADQQYHSILKSSDAMRWHIYTERKKQEVRQRESQLQKTQQGTHEYSVLVEEQKKARIVLAEDLKAKACHMGARDAFLELAIDMYSRCLASSDRFDDDGPIRFSSLWFANFDDLGIQDKLKVALDRVPSRKFVFLSHQLSARMSKSSAETPKNQHNLQGLVLRMCQEHPFHSLYQVFCLRPEQPQGVRRTSSRFELPSSQSDRGGAASAIFDRLLSDPTQTARIRSIEQVCNASLEWAKYPVKHPTIKKTNNGLLIPDALPIRKLRDVQVPVITCRTPIDPTLKYNDCIWISRYHPEFTPAGGINHPKISTCYGSNGEQFKQLFKGEGNDDMRQDAVMEQVFHLCNMVLRYDKETRRRNLNVRDYKVLPLATQAGVIEFVGNTVPLQKWLQEAHSRYRPSDLKHGQILTMLKQTREKNGGKTEAMVKTFQLICQRTQPVMRHYFTEKHKTPITWFAMRLNYTRSVATTSIVGHILGLGDRHVQNILIDNGSGEVVHIDLGIAFDQGKLLRIPERVPFRMTRDMVDGMGKCGTQGVFQRCAEETLRVLRDRSDVILTVLEVFKHDPLHSWTASELKIKKVQDNTAEPTRFARDVSRFGAIAIDLQSGSADEAADRALAGVARKLDKALSVEYTVNELIAEATDIVNLATIYQGWSPDY